MIPHNLTRMLLSVVLYLASIGSCNARSVSVSEAETVLARCGSIRVLASHRRLFRRWGIDRMLPYVSPLRERYQLTSSYGMRRHPIRHQWLFHRGYDMACPAGTRIHATADGIVVFCGERGGYGNCVILRHAFGFETLYGHMARTHTRLGRRVFRGEVIGFVGSTGISTGPHLHYETRKHGIAIEPFIP